MFHHRGHRGHRDYITLNIFINKILKLCALCVLCGESLCLYDKLQSHVFATVDFAKTDALF